MKKIGDGLDDFFAGLGISDDNNYLGFVGAWRRIAGEGLGSHSKPWDLRGSVLLVCVDHPGWMTRMRFEEERIISQIRSDFPQLGISALAFKLVEKLPKSHIVAKPEQAVENPVAASGQIVDKNEKNFSPAPQPNELTAALERLRNKISTRNNKDSQ